MAPPGVEDAQEMCNSTLLHRWSISEGGEVDGSWSRDLALPVHVVPPEGTFEVTAPAWHLGCEEIPLLETGLVRGYHVQLPVTEPRVLEPTEISQLVGLHDR